MTETKFDECDECREMLVLTECNSCTQWFCARCIDHHYGCKSKSLPIQHNKGPITMQLMKNTKTGEVFAARNIECPSCNELFIINGMKIKNAMYCPYCGVRIELV